jgi:hypothetical protein
LQNIITINIDKIHLIPSLTSFMMIFTSMSGERMVTSILMDRIPRGPRSWYVVYIHAWPLGFDNWFGACSITINLVRVLEEFMNEASAVMMVRDLVLEARRIRFRAYSSVYRLGELWLDLVVAQLRCDGCYIN